KLPSNDSVREPCALPPLLAPNIPYGLDVLYKVKEPNETSGEIIQGGDNSKLIQDQKQAELIQGVDSSKNLDTPDADASGKFERLKDLDTECRSFNGIPEHVQQLLRGTTLPSAMTKSDVEIPNSLNVFLSDIVHELFDSDPEETKTTQSDSNITNKTCTESRNKSVHAENAENEREGSLKDNNSSNEEGYQLDVPLEQNLQDSIESISIQPQLDPIEQSPIFNAPFNENSQFWQVRPGQAVEQDVKEHSVDLLCSNVTSSPTPNSNGSINHSQQCITQGDSELLAIESYVLQIVEKHNLNLCSDIKRFFEKIKKSQEH
ncbi:hypothetical protein HDV01_004932, partial [Terramyces sp. JEL0728]